MLDCHVGDPALVPALRPTLLGRPIGEILPPDDAARIAAVAGAVFATGRPDAVACTLATPAGPRPVGIHMARTLDDRVLALVHPAPAP